MTDELRTLDITAAVNAASAGHGWNGVTRTFGLAELGRYTWLEYEWGSAQTDPGTPITSELAPLILVSLRRDDTMRLMRTLQGPTSWVQHPAGRYTIRVAIQFEVQGAVGMGRPRIRVVSGWVRPMCSWTSAGPVLPGPVKLLPGQARYVYSQQPNASTAGIVIDWFRGPTALFAFGAGARISGQNERARIPDGATHFREAAPNQAFTFE